MIWEETKMSEQRGNLRESNRMGRRIVLLLLMTAALIWSAPAFAEEDEEETVPELSVIVGENGTVNDQREDFTMQMMPGEDITLALQGDEGFVVDQVLINDVPLEEEDMENVSGESSANLELEGVDSNISVAVMFAQDETGDENDEGSEETEAGELSGSEESAAPKETEPSETEPVTVDPDAGGSTGGAASEESSDDGNAEEAADTGVSEGHSPQTGDPVALIAVLLVLASATLIGIVCCSRLCNRRGLRS